MATPFNLDKLSPDQLRDFYKLLRADQRTTDPASPVDPESVTIPPGRENDVDWLKRSISRSLTAYDKDGRLGGDRRTTIGEEPTPEDRLAAKIKGYVADPSKLPAANSNGTRFTEYMLLTMYGHPTSLDGNLANDTASLKSLSDNMGRSTDYIRETGARAQARAEQALAATRAEQAVKDQRTMAMEGALRTFGIDVGDIDGKIDLKDENPYSAHFAGKAHPVDQLLVDNQEALQRHFGDNLADIRNGMFADPAKGDFTLTDAGLKTMGYLVQNTDLREKVSELLNSDKPDEVRQGQALLRLSGIEGAEDLKITGTLDPETAKIASQYFATPQGMGDRVFRFTNADLGGPYRHEVSGAYILREMKAGRLVIDEAGLSEQMRKDLEGLDPNSPEYREEISMYLTDPNNLKSYNEYLISKGARADLVKGMKDKMAGLETENARLALRGTLVEKFYAATEDLRTIQKHLGIQHSDINSQFAAATEARTLAGTGDLDGAIDKISGRVDATLASIETKQLAIINRHISAINKMEGFEGLSDREILAKLRTPEGFEQFDRGTTGWGGATLRSTFVQGSQWRGLSGAYTRFAEIRDGIRTSAKPVPGGDHLGPTFRDARDDLISEVKPTGLEIERRIAAAHAVSFDH